MDSTPAFTTITKAIPRGARFMGAALAVALAATPALADDHATSSVEARRWDAPLVSASLNLGFATPYGMYGGELEIGLARWAAVAIGVGDNDGAMVAGAGRLRHVFGGNAVGLSVGLGYGDGAVDVFTGRARKVLNATWLDVDAYIEHRFNGVLMVRGYVGATRALRFDTCPATGYQSGCGPVDEAMYPTVGLAAGFYL